MVKSVFLCIVMTIAIIASANAYIGSEGLLIDEIHADASIAIDEANVVPKSDLYFRGLKNTKNDKDHKKDKDEAQGDEQAITAENEAEDEAQKKEKEDENEEEPEPDHAKEAKASKKKIKAATEAVEQDDNGGKPNMMLYGVVGALVFVGIIVGLISMASHSREGYTPIE
ncbi:hypothetical protein ACHAXN_002081 [Cyclotella atomus]